MMPSLGGLHPRMPSCKILVSRYAPVESAREAVGATDGRNAVLVYHNLQSLQVAHQGECVSDKYRVVWFQHGGRLNSDHKVSLSFQKEGYFQTVF
jgi:hypothetical protein